jgi:hypothetical protein
MSRRIAAAALFASLAFAASAQAQGQLRPAMKIPDPRANFIRECVPHVSGRWERPEEVCGCLHDRAVALIDDEDLRDALLRGISETGVPTIEAEWLPAAKQADIGATFTKIARPALQCLFEPAK